MVTPDGRPGCPYAVLFAHRPTNYRSKPIYVITVTIIDSIDYLGKTQMRLHVGSTSGIDSVNQTDHSVIYIQDIPPPPTLPSYFNL